MKMITLKAQHSYELDVAPGMNLLIIKVLMGTVIINHGMYTPDGGTWLCSPCDGRRAHYECREGELHRFTFDIRYSFNHLDRVEIVNPKLFHAAICELKVFNSEDEG